MVVRIRTNTEHLLVHGRRGHPIHQEVTSLTEQTVTQVEVRGFRANCSVASGCTSSDTNTVSWFILENLVNPILLKNPNLASLCEGVDVSATIQTPGSGGNGCSDVLQYRINAGAGYSAWASYNAGDAINTSGSIGVQIRGYRSLCISGSQCPPVDTLIYTWTVSPTASSSNYYKSS